MTHELRNPAMDPEPEAPRDFLAEARRILSSGSAFIVQREHLLALAAHANFQADRADKTVKFYGDVLAAVMVDTIGAVSMKMPLAMFQEVSKGEPSVVPVIEETEQMLYVSLIFRQPPPGLALRLASTPERQM